MAELSKVYDPQNVEERWYAYWLEKKAFRAEVEPEKEPYCIVIPPPNVTGQLHIGHALDNTLQDVLMRWQRMKGKNACWIPGTDHAGIATQIKVEEALAKEGLDRHQLGREAFLQRVWDWKEEYGDRIVNQLKRLGTSCDWDRLRFTMDEGCSQAVREVFVRLYEKGLIYQGNRMINWCPRCATALSDVEVGHEESQGQIWHIQYPLSDGSGQITVATTRPETMLGDTGIAVHPKDERYTHLLGKMVTVPLINREIPVVGDEYVDPSFGTGMVKVTPAHDPNDFEIGERHGLPQIQVIGGDATMTQEAGPYAGMDRYACRKQLIGDLQAMGLLAKVVEEHSHAVGQCTRCETVVEPLVSKQWFVKMKPLAEPAIEAVKDGRIRFVPARFEKIYLNWVENVRDWCISRQLWWGHRIPVWTCQECGEVHVLREDPTQCAHCGGQLQQDPDVLDTWFSSALWPFSTMGWPQQTPDLAHFYPTAVLVTGFDIIYFWVARMVFMGMEFMGEVPFRDVYIHGLLRDAQGRKMSKSLGNGVDPIEVIDEYGCDALRFTLVTGVAPGNDMRFQLERVESSRNFLNKIWNAARFALMHLEEDLQPINPSTLADRWILSRLSWVTGEVERQLGRYELGEAARVLYEFVWSEFCDWYIELAKPRLYGDRGDEAKAEARAVLAEVLEQTMALLHPFLPYLTSEIWAHLPGERGMLMHSTWPTPRLDRDEATEGQMETFQEVVRSIRNIRNEMNVYPGKKIEAVLQADPELLGFFEPLTGDLSQMAGIGELSLIGPLEPKPSKAMTAVVGGLTIYLPLAGLVDLDLELARIAKELGEVVEEKARIESKLGNEGFVSKAPPQVVAKEREKLQGLLEKEERLRERHKDLMG